MKSCIYGRHLWHVEVFWGKLYCVRYSLRSCIGGVCLVAYVVFHYWYYVPAVFYMW